MDSLSEEIPEAKSELRAARVATVEYSGLRALADKLRGRYQENAETLARHNQLERAAQAELQILDLRKLLKQFR